MGLDEKIAAVQEKLEQIRKEQERIVYEQLSCKIYDYEDQKAGLVAERVDQEQEVIRLAGVKDSLQRKLLTCELNRLYQELRKFEMRKAEVDEKIQALLQKTEDSREEIEAIGHQLYQWYTQETGRWNVKRAAEEEAYRNTSEKEQNAVNEQKKNEQQLFSLSGKIGGLKSQTNIMTRRRRRSTESSMPVSTEIYWDFMKKDFWRSVKKRWQQSF